MASVIFHFATIEVDLNVGPDIQDITDNLNRIINGIDLSESQMSEMMEEILSGTITDAQIGAMMAALAPDVSFHTPVYFSAIEDRRVVSILLEVLLETFETACTWDGLARLHADVTDEVTVQASGDS